ncbi:nucleoside-diphosphate sugar epimerase [Paenibacillus lentus]|uniref:Nucleoside-diphosphate sugar epimerase n=1 Tax=Paenibacillus lentus TaxID=1338368 RepID=A0A3S8RZL7_9BACL|nr:nucleoside-diphosphate sugar epimerase [Paenibacillus lentus]AZK48365.1 nucleoside-diphosphate sugar epimerase [Paenibacillus lentus]
MDQKITDMLIHMSHSHGQIARIIDAERHVVVRIAQIIHAIPDAEPAFDGTDGLVESAGRINKSVVAYLNSIADLEEAMAENLELVIKELKDQDEE